MGEKKMSFSFPPFSFPPFELSSLRASVPLFANGAFPAARIIKSNLEVICDHFLSEQLCRGRGQSPAAGRSVGANGDEDWSRESPVLLGRVFQANRVGD